MKFTNHDTQNEDWTYYIGYKTGKKIEEKRGQRKKTTKKWNGVGKKESQIINRQVVFIDLDRTMPARNFSTKIFSLAKNSAMTAISNVSAIEEYVSYILEEKFTLNKLAKHLDKDIFRYKNQNQYSSFNAATGEEVLVKIVIDIVEAKSNALILVDEVEVGLHPKIQRRLIDVIYHIAATQNKQFILTSHSPTILSSVSEKSRIFIERKANGDCKAISPISVNAAMSKMDSESYPLFDLFCEDDIAKKIIYKAISYISIEKGLNNFGSLVNIIITDSADNTYAIFKAHERTYEHKKIKSGYACVLDGDMKAKKRGAELMYPPENKLHFLYSNHPPEKFLLQVYLDKHPNSSLQYHLDNTNVHSLFSKMVEFTTATTTTEAFEMCWNDFLESDQGEKYFLSLVDFLLNTASAFSPDL